MKLVVSQSHFHIDKCVGCKTCTHVCPTRAYIPSLHRPLDKKKSAPCSSKCPIGNDIEGFLSLIGQRKYLDAYTLLLKTNPLPGITGRVCHSPCELDCNRSQFDEGISIQALERFVADWARQEGYQGVKPKLRYQEKIAIVGSGPAGLASAYHLANGGYRVTLFEAAREAGGTLRFGIPEYRLPKKVLEWEIEKIRSLGVKLQFKKRLGENLKWNDLRDFDAVFISTGLQKHTPMRIPGEDMDGVWNALDFLEKINSGQTISLGKKVAIIGGGNAAIDAARSALRLGSIPILLYRRSFVEMPAFPSEVKELAREGIRVLTLVMPNRVIAREGRVHQIECLRTQLGKSGKDGRRIPVPISRSNFVLDVDSIIVAAGQRPDFSPLPPSVKMIGSNGMTTRKKIYGGGDIATKAGTVSEAIASGKKGAMAIHRFLRKEGAQKNGQEPEIVRLEDLNPDYFDPSLRIPSGCLDVSKAVSSFDEVHLGYQEDKAIHEAQRCFGCAAPPQYRVEDCRGCSNCEQRCPASAITIEPCQNPYEVGVDPAQFDRTQISNLCMRARMHPQQIICYCTNTTAGEIAAAILKGANTPEAVSRLTGARTGCTVLCIQSIMRLLEASGSAFKPQETHQCYGKTFTLWDVESKGKEKYDAAGYHFGEDMELIERIFKKD
jgi:NADPH-dependent glutamate synthase beta subunit-like oxidoreductase/NAD-dependent dihydropyrimidine dehydrogenase PreA subunit/bacterioferritin-associated ferredoxin